MPSSLSFSIQRLIVSALTLVVAATCFGQSTLISLPTRRGMVFNHAGNYLYMTTSDGFVRRYNLSTKKLDASYNIGGSLYGLDIAKDDSFLLLADGTLNGSDGVIHKLDLKTGSVLNLTYPVEWAEGGSYDVAITSNGRAFFTFTNGYAPVSQIDLATNAITARRDASTYGINGAITDGSRIMRSADGSRLYFLEGDSSPGTLFTYSAASDTFGPPAIVPQALDYSGAAVNRDGTLVATRLTDRLLLDSAPDFHFLHSFNPTSDAVFEGAVAFDGARDTMYGVNTGSGQIVAYDTKTFGEQLRMTIGEDVGFWPDPFGTGTLAASRDGRFLAIETPSGIRLFTLPTTLPAPKPPPTPVPSLATRQGMVFDHPGKFIYFSTYTGCVERYSVADGQVSVISNPGGLLNGIDISPDDSYVVVAQDDTGIAEGRFHKIKLSDGSITNLDYRLTGEEGGGWDVKIASNGLAFVTTQLWGLGTITLRQIDLSTGAFSFRTDAPSTYSDGHVMQNSVIVRNADRTRLYFLEPNSSDGPAFTYDSVTDHFSRWGKVGETLSYASAAVDRTGNVVATRPRFNTLIDTADFHYVTSGRPVDSGLVFDPTRDVLYGANSATDEIIALDPATLAEKFRFPIGLHIDPNESTFNSGTLIASDDGSRLALATPATIQVINVPTAPNPPGPPLLADPRGMVFDHQGRHLYITTANGIVWPYNVATQLFDPPYVVGGSLLGVDIAPDDSFLMVADAMHGMAEGGIHKIDLSTHSTTTVSFDPGYYETGAWDVAIAANGLAFFTTSSAVGSYLHQIDLTTGQSSIRSDVQGNLVQGLLNQNLPIRRSADGTRLYLLETNTSNGPLLTYDSAANSFTVANPTQPAIGLTGAASASIAVNRDGSLLGTRIVGHNAFLETAPDCNFVQSFTGLDSGITFSSTQDILFGINSSADQIVAYDTKTFAELSRFDIGEPINAGATQFGTGSLVGSGDGRYLAVMTDTSIRVFDALAGTPLPTPTPTPTPIPTPTPTPTPFSTPTPTPTPSATPIVSLTSSGSVSEGGTATFTISASSNTGRPVTISYAMSGKAILDIDYTLSPSGAVTIPVGQNSATVTLSATIDHSKEKKESATMTLSPGSGYSLGVSPGKKKKKIKAPGATIFFIDTP